MAVTELVSTEVADSLKEGQEVQVYASIKNISGLPQELWAWLIDLDRPVYEQLIGGPYMQAVQPGQTIRIALTNSATGSWTGMLARDLNLTIAGGYILKENGGRATEEFTVLKEIKLAMPEPIGSIVGIEAPEFLWELTPLMAYATIQNTGDAGTIYYRMQSVGLEDDTGVLSTHFEAGETIRVPLVDAVTQEWLTPQRQSGQPTNRNLNISVWHNAEPDDSKTFTFWFITASVIIDFVSYLPSQAPAGAKFIISISSSMRTNVSGETGFIKISDADTGEVRDYITFEIKDRVSRADKFTETMPDKDLNLLIESGVQMPLGLKVQSNFTHTILLGIAEGKAVIFGEIAYPPKAYVDQEANIVADFDNLGEVTDTIFSKLYMNGVIVDETRNEINVSQGKRRYITVLMPEEEAIVPFRFEVGHDEQGIDVVDDFREFSIEAWSPATLNIDTKPIKGPISVDGARIGLAPQTVLVEAGTRVIGFEEVMGYAKPQPQEVVIQKGETRDILGVYEPTAGLPFLPIIGIVLVIGVAAFLITR